MPDRYYKEILKYAYPRKRALWFYRWDYQFWLWISLALSIAFFQWCTKSEFVPQVIDRQLDDHQTILWAYHVQLALAALLLFIGIWWFHIRFEIVGHVLLATGILISAVSIGIEMGYGYGFIITASLGLSSLFRMGYILYTLPHMSDTDPDG